MPTFVVNLPAPGTGGGFFKLSLDIQDDRAYALWLPYFEQLQRLIDLEDRMGVIDDAG